MGVALEEMNLASQPRHLLRIVPRHATKSFRVFHLNIKGGQLKVATYLQAVTIILSSSTTPTTAICGI